MKIIQRHKDLLPIPDHLDINFDWKGNDHLQMLEDLRERYKRVAMFKKVDMITEEYRILATSIVLNKYNLRLLRIKCEIPEDEWYRIMEYNPDGTINNMLYLGNNIKIIRTNKFVDTISREILESLPINFAIKKNFVLYFRDNKYNDGRYNYFIINKSERDYYIAFYHWYLKDDSLLIFYPRCLREAIKLNRNE